ncbi:selenocysteine-tRNA-specific elongation factor [Trypanosoma cruzi]|nr:selenocysteine-tRNA-specific elongation factor [Trypanosoma cruzi]
MRMTPSRGRLGLSWIDGELDRCCCDANCATIMDTTRLIATCAQKGFLRTTSERQKTTKGLPAAYEGGRRRPHPFHHLPPLRTEDVAPHRRFSIRSFESPHAIVKKRKGAYPPRRSTVVPRITDIFALCQLNEEGERGGSRNAGAVKVGAENVASGAIHKFLLHARAADQREEMPDHFDGNMRCGAIDPTAARQDDGGPCCKWIEPRWTWWFSGYQKLRRDRRRSRRAP